VTSYLLDANIISDLIRNPHGAVFEKIAQIGDDNVATNVVVAAELRFGGEKKGSSALIERIELLLSRFRILSLETGVDRIYGKVRAELETKGTPIGANDLLIASHTLFLAQSDPWVLVTANVKEFERVDGLKVENWLG